MFKFILIAIVYFGGYVFFSYGVKHSCVKDSIYSKSLPILWPFYCIWALIYYIIQALIIFFKDYFFESLKNIFHS